jgi:RimJ/RimL family protein N-acetyltransferase
MANDLRARLGLALDDLAARPAPLPVLNTDRLVLRPWRDEDVGPFAAMCADPEVMAHFPSTLSWAASAARLARFRTDAARDGLGAWAVEAHDGGFVGMVGLEVIRFEVPFTPAVEIGWRFARSHWGKGLALEAARAAVDDGFGRCRLPEIISFTAEQNVRSWRLMERLGMVRRGDFLHPELPNGHALRAHRLYQMLPASASHGRDLARQGSTT